MTSFVNIVANTLLPIFLIVGLGVLAERRLGVKPRAFSRVVVYLFSPCLVLGSMASSELVAEELGGIMGSAVLMSILMTAIGSALARLLHLDLKSASAFTLSVVLVNAGNYGLALNEFAYGSAGVERAVAFFVVTAMVGNTLGIYLASRGAASVRRSLLNVLTVPLPYATALGLYLNLSGRSLPLPIVRAVNVLGDAAVPCMMLVLGLRLSQTVVKGRLGPIALATGVRLVIAPLIAFPLTAALGLTGLARDVSIIEASMPTAVMAGVLATEFGGDAEFVTAVILVSTVASALSLGILLSILM
jgi:predicted permease